jgi:hypothetical protein
MRKSVYQRLKEINDIEDMKQRVHALQNVEGKSAIKTLLDYTFNKNIIMKLPDGIPPYKPLDSSIDAQGMLEHDTRKLYIFLDGQAPGLTQSRKEQIFIGILEGIDNDDAKLLCSIKDKKLPFTKITKALVKKAFPTLIKE